MGTQLFRQASVSVVAGLTLHARSRALGDSSDSLGTASAGYIPHNEAPRGQSSAQRFARPCPDGARRAVMCGYETSVRSDALAHSSACIVARGCRFGAWFDSSHADGPPASEWLAISDSISVRRFDGHELLPCDGRLWCDGRAPGYGRRSGNDSAG